MPKPSFSKQHGFYAKPFSLTLTAEGKRSIRYTTDGSTPTAKRGVVYSSPLTIKGTTPVRAVAYDKSGKTSEVVAKTYIFLSQVRRQGNSPKGFPDTFALDDGYGPNALVTPNYDPMIAKLIVKGRNREEAIERSIRALEGYTIEGIKTNIPLHLRILKHPVFREGKLDTKFLEHHAKP